MQINDVRVAAAGTAGWTVALVVLLIADLPSGDRWWLWTCVAGIVIGLFGVWYIPRLQAGRARQAEARATRRPDPPSGQGQADGDQADPDQAPTDRTAGR
jgi:hypothetical protein